MQYLFNKIKLIFNIMKYSIIKPREITILNRDTGDVQECKHKNRVKVKTEFYGWKDKED